MPLQHGNRPLLHNPLVDEAIGFESLHLKLVVALEVAYATAGPWLRSNQQEHLDLHPKSLRSNQASLSPMPSSRLDYNTQS